MKRHCSTERLTASDLVLRVRVQVEAEPLAVLAVARAAQLERELERLHERGRADHVVVVERAPAGVAVLVAEQPLRGQQRGVLGEVLAVHDQVLPVHVDLDVVDPLRSRSLWISCSAIPMFPHVVFMAGSQSPCSRKTLTTVPRRRSRPPRRRPRSSHRPALPVGRLERVVVALDPGPDDEVRAQLAGEVRPPRA